MDNFMFFIRDILFWVPLLFLLLFIIVSYYRNRKNRHTGLSLLLISSLIAVQLILCILVIPYFLDQFAVRERPIYNPEFTDVVNLETFTFTDRPTILSAKACAVAAIAFFLLLFYEIPKWLKGGLIFWMLLISFNRIYIGAQYPSNILVSLSLGAGLGLFAYRYYDYLKTRILDI